jgi:hypothetical protein
VRLLGYHQNASNQICGDFTKVSIYLEYFENSLEKEIERRIEVKYSLNLKKGKENTIFLRARTMAHPLREHISTVLLGD